MLVDFTLQSSDKSFSSNRFSFVTMSSFIYCKTHCLDQPISFLVYTQTHPKVFEMDW